MCVCVCVVCTYMCVWCVNAYVCMHMCVCWWILNLGFMHSREVLSHGVHPNSTWAMSKCICGLCWLRSRMWVLVLLASPVVVVLPRQYPWKTPPFLLWTLFSWLYSKVFCSSSYVGFYCFFFNQDIFSFLKLLGFEIIPTEWLLMFSSYYNCVIDSVFLVLS